MLESRNNILISSCDNKKLNFHSSTIQTWEKGETCSKVRSKQETFKNWGIDCKPKMPIIYRKGLEMEDIVKNNWGADKKGVKSIIDCKKRTQSSHEPRGRTSMLWRYRRGGSLAVPPHGLGVHPLLLELGKILLIQLQVLLWVPRGHGASLYLRGSWGLGETTLCLYLPASGNLGLCLSCEGALPLALPGTHRGRD